MENEQIAFVAAAREALKQNLRWGGMLVVIGYVLLGIGLLFGVIGTFAVAVTSGWFALIMAFVYAVSFGLYYFPLQRLNRYLQGCRKALETHDESHLVTALASLGSTFRLLVLYTFTLIGLYVILLGVFFAFGITNSLLTT